MSQPMSHPSWIGHTISGRYKIESLLGQGGMSSVYKATDPNLRRTVAVKLIHPHLSSDPEFVRRFEQEAAAVAQLRHQNIIQVYDFNHDGDVYYMVLEYVDGQTLQDRLTELIVRNDLFPLSDTIRIMATVCDAVAYAHEKNMIHRDLKPANVMLNKKGQPILMDFGVAKMLGTAQHTATGAIIGTAKYMSPEQARGERPDARTDIYSLGVMLYEMVTGATPFEGESTVSILMKHVTEKVPDIRSLQQDIPPGLVAVIEKALAKDRTERYQTAAQLAAALRAIDLSESPTMLEIPDAGATMLQSQPRPTPPVPAPPSPASAAPVPSPGATPVAPPPAVKPTQKQAGGPPLGLIIGGGVVVLLLIVGGLVALFALGGSNEGEASASPTAPTQPATEAPAVVEVVETATDTALPPTATEAAGAAATDTPLPATATPQPTEAVSDVLPGATDTPAEPSPTPSPQSTATAVPTEPPPPPSPPPGMVFVPAGFFQMGSTDGEPNEQPEHPVLLDGFFIDRTEVTNADYRDCVSNGACTPAQKADAFTYTGYRDDPAFDNYPVIAIDWDQARAYCQFAGKRLPTEAEWEYAASGPNNLTWPWGNTFDPNLSAANSPDTQPVDSFPNGASPFGVLNMAGNVNEWVEDVFSEGFYASSPTSNPVATGSGDRRVFRGGSFANPDGAFYTTSRRYDNLRSFAEVDIGVRCAADAPNASPSPELTGEFCAVYAGFKPGASCP